ncbi:alpha-hydroxy-acid oxidizing protein [Pelagicoccus mobilis]|uniref:Alpha-hydroxy-acid oxidizing protein n=1 Tax=Pelagicoccus mobilis TaxID=415221 RepID=A0A934RW57_9BACT|nr:alpha-hydroxy-acid oxidizing protein [Pelagicoccus mobilis]MBK1877468.1 alpha-hydroxy-acid oxidizing protein [Pelagicoccus mobilis]
MPVGDDICVLFDSGVRHGDDVVKTLALGADAVLLGRPYAYGLVVGGEEGVQKVIRQILGEYDVTMALSGYTTPRLLNRSILQPV